MRYGLTLPGRGPLVTPDNLAIIAKRAEELGYYMALFGDHIVVPRHITSTYPYTADGAFPGSLLGDCALLDGCAHGRLPLVVGAPSTVGSRGHGNVSPQLRFPNN